MSEVTKIGGCDWKALEVRGLGVIVQAEMGLIFVRGAAIENGELVGRIVEGEAPLQVASRPAKPALSSQASVCIAAFEEEMKRRNLRHDGEYGVLGAYIAKLREVLAHVEPDSDMESAFGSLLALGDRGKLGTAAFIYTMTPKLLDEFKQVLDHPEPDLVQEFVDRVIVGAA